MRNTAANNLNKTPPVHVAVGVILNSSNEVLVSLRSADSHQGGLWEFPGGKLEAGEDVRNALRREFSEELGIHIGKCFPIKKIQHCYEDKTVLLDVWRIDEFQGTPRGCEGQAIEWRQITDLTEEDFPAANAAIVKTLQLPQEIAITANAINFGHLEEILDNLLAQDLPLIQFRQKNVEPAVYRQWFDWAQKRCAKSQANLIFNQELSDAEEHSPVNYHASAARLLSLRDRPVANDLLFTASCHNLSELKAAEELDVDFAYLSPIKQTEKYSNDQLLGWDNFQKLASQVSIPVYALGGLQRNELKTALAHGASGIAAISAYISR